MTSTLSIHPSDVLRAAIDRARGDKARAKALLRWMAEDPNSAWILGRLLDLVLYLQEQGRGAKRPKGNRDLSPALVEILEAARRQPWNGKTWREIHVAETFLGPVQTPEEREAKDERLIEALTRMGALNDKANSPRVKAALLLASAAGGDEDAVLDQLEAYARTRLAELRSA